MDMESCILIMEIFCKVNLRMVDVREKADGSSTMALIIKETLRIMQQMDMENISISISMFIKVSGKIIYPMEKVKLNILMVADIMESF